MAFHRKSLGHQILGYLGIDGALSWPIHANRESILPVLAVLPMPRRTHLHWTLPPKSGNHGQIIRCQCPVGWWDGWKRHYRVSFRGSVARCGLCLVTRGSPVRIYLCFCIRTLLNLRCLKRVLVSTRVRQLALEFIDLRIVLARYVSLDLCSTKTLNQYQRSAKPV